MKMNRESFFFVTCSLEDTNKREALIRLSENTQKDCKKLLITLISLSVVIVHDNKKEPLSKKMFISE